MSNAKIISVLLIYLKLIRSENGMEWKKKKKALKFLSFFINLSKIKE